MVLNPLPVRSQLDGAVWVRFGTWARRSERCLVEVVTSRRRRPRPHPAVVVQVRRAVQAPYSREIQLGQADCRRTARHEATCRLLLCRHWAQVLFRPLYPVATTALCLCLCLCPCLSLLLSLSLASSLLARHSWTVWVNRREQRNCGPLTRTTSLCDRLTVCWLAVCLCVCWLCVSLCVYLFRFVAQPQQQPHLT